MPPRIQMQRPQRLWMPRPSMARQPAATTGSRGRGTIAPGGIDTSSTGNVGGDFVKAINAQIQQNRQNALANQFMNTQTPPRAAWVGGAAPAAGVPTAGTAPQSGGMGELQFRQQQQAQEAEANRQALNDAYTKARIANQYAQIAQRGNAPRGTKPGKPAPYVPGSGDVQNDPSTDNFTQIQADFDAQHGKGAYNMFTKNFSNLQPDGKGNLVIMGPDPNDPTKQAPLMDSKGLPVYSIPQADAGYWMNRYNAARIRGGQNYLGSLPQGTNPNSGQSSGQSQVNPVPVKTNLEARALPDGTWIQLPDGSTQQIQRTPGQRAAQQAQEQPAATDTTDTTGQDQTDAETQLAQQEEENT